MTQTSIWKEFTLESAHWLPHVPEDHKCRRMHGHSFKVRVYLRGSADNRLGWVADFAEIKTAFADIHERLDHRILNEIPGLENPTSENLAKWVYNDMRQKIGQTHAVEVQETCSSGARYPDLSYSL